MTEAGKPDNDALKAIQTFLNEEGVDAAVTKACIQGYTGYIATLVTEIM